MRLYKIILEEMLSSLWFLENRRIFRPMLLPVLHWCNPIRTKNYFSAWILSLQLQRQLTFAVNWRQREYVEVIFPVCSIISCIKLTFIMFLKDWIGTLDPRKQMSLQEDRRPSVLVTSPSSPDRQPLRPHHTSVGGRIKVINLCS